ncbi:MAG TPA: hypothetical protein VFY34_12695 [Pyrinomonadaceae bacterium]|nr:hypothetical protein [Pyrinomonadaceae bacterium]
MTRRILLGAAAGLLSALVCVGIAYVVGVVTIAVDVREFLPTLLAAVTVLPLMLLFVVLLPTLVIGLLTGATIGVTAGYSPRVYLIGAVAGLLFGVVLLSGVLPLILAPQPGDFTSIVARPLWAGIYALFLGLLTSRFFRWFYAYSNTGTEKHYR